MEEVPVEEKKVEETEDMDEDTRIRNKINIIWEKYDTDKNGSLDRDETKKFMVESFNELGQEIEWTQQIFNEAFDELDTNKNGTIEKDEVFTFFKELA